MLINRHQVTIEWGHCDPAGIVYFPNYFSFFDSSANALFLRALGFNKYEMLRKYDIVGIPVVDVAARFHRSFGVRRCGDGRIDSGGDKAVELSDAASAAEG